MLSVQSKVNAQCFNKPPASEVRTLCSGEVQSALWSRMPEVAGSNAGAGIFIPLCIQEEFEVDGRATWK